MESDSISSFSGHNVFSRFRGGNPEIVDLSGECHFVQGLGDFAREIEFEHNARVQLGVVAFSVEAASGKGVVIEIDFNSFHYQIPY